MPKMIWQAQKNLQEEEEKKVKLNEVVDDGQKARAGVSDEIWDLWYLVLGFYS